MDKLIVTTGGIMDVGVRELRDHLSRHLAQVRSGSTITVTDHGQPIARIVPVDRPTALEVLKAAGKVTPASRTKVGLPDPVEASGSVSDLVDDQRR
ncbi:MAG TPA: type II toxin-antitoxin system prevent-host-death family antitoxin [Nakamurella sp.]